MKRISVDHLARVEGNGGISATIDGNTVTDVKFTINEGPRLIEKLTLGRTPDEDVSMSPRICAICSISHKNAVIRAMENALSVKVAPKVTLLRELMHMGEMIESHSLHVYYLALPDYVGYPNAIAMASKYDFEVKVALEMKNYGNHIMKVIGGRYIHGENPVIGGFGRFPTEQELLFLKSRAIQFMPFVQKTVNLFCELDYPECPEDEPIYSCSEPGAGTRQSEETTKTRSAKPPLTALIAAFRALDPALKEDEKSAVNMSLRRSAAAARMLADSLPL